MADISSWLSCDDEPLGARDKQWVAPDPLDESRWWLWKAGRSRGIPEPGADLWAASLGFNVPPSRRADVGAAARRGKARHFPGKPTLVDLARHGLSMVRDATATRILEPVVQLDIQQVRTAVESVPNGWMSAGARTFVVELIAENRRRLLQ